MSFLNDIQEYYAERHDIPEADPATREQLDFIYTLLLDRADPPKQVEQWVWARMEGLTYKGAREVLDVLMPYVPHGFLSSQKQIQQLLEDRIARD